MGHYYAVGARVIRRRDTVTSAARARVPHNVGTLRVVKLVYLRRRFQRATERRRKKRKGAFCETGRAGRVRIPDFPVYRDITATPSDRYACRDKRHNAPPLIIRDTRSELSGSRPREGDLAPFRGEGQVSTDTKQREAALQNCGHFSGLPPSTGCVLVCPARDIRSRGKRPARRMDRDFQGPEFRGSAAVSLGRPPHAFFLFRSGIRSSRDPRSQPESQPHLFVSSCN